MVFLWKPVTEGLGCCVTSYSAISQLWVQALALGIAVLAMLFSLAAYIHLGASVELKLEVSIAFKVLLKVLWNARLGPISPS